MHFMFLAYNFRRLHEFHPILAVVEVVAAVEMVQRLLLLGALLTWYEVR